MAHAFRCHTCGHLHTAEHAGEETIPAACSVCGSGVKFCPKTGVKSKCEDNWEVLADAEPERLEELGLAPEHICKHLPVKGGVTTRPPQHVQLTAGEGTGVADRAG